MLTEQELIDLWTRIEPTCVGNMSRRHEDGTIRPITNIEMLAAMAADGEERLLRLATAKWIEAFTVWVMRGCRLEEPEDEQLEVLSHE